MPQRSYSARRLSSSHYPSSSWRSPAVFCAWWWSARFSRASSSLLDHPSCSRYMKFRKRKLEKMIRTRTQIYSALFFFKEPYSIKQILLSDASHRELQSHGILVRYPGDSLHGAQYRRHEEVFRNTLLHPGAESILLVARRLRLLLLYCVGRHPRHSQVTIAARPSHLGPDHAGGGHRPHRSGASDESAENRGRG